MPRHGPVHVVVVPGGSIGCQIPVLVDIEVLLVGGVVEFPVIQFLLFQEISQFLLFPIFQMVRVAKTCGIGGLE